VRLHKYEFEFVMPDHEAAPMTRVAGTGLADADPAADEIEDIKAAAAGQAMDLDLDFSADESADAHVAKAATEDETLMPDYDDKPADETLMPDYRHGAAEAPAAPPPANPPFEDETIMPGQFDEGDEEATIRPGQNSSSNEVFDVTGADDDKDR
jgi:hypothetical protein